MSQTKSRFKTLEIKILYKGEPLDFYPEVCHKLKNFLDKLPDNTLLSYYDVSEQLGIKYNYLRNIITRFPEFKQYRIRLKGKSFLGNVKTIKKLRGDK